MRNSKSIKDQIKPLLLRTTLFVLGDENIGKTMFIKEFLKNSSNICDQNDIYYESLNFKKNEFPMRIIEINLNLESSILSNFPKHEVFQESEMGFIYLYNTNITKSHKLLMKFIEEINQLLNKQNRSPDEEKFINNYGKKTDYMVIGIINQEEDKNNNDLIDFCRNHSLNHFIFSKKNPESINEIKNALLSKLSEIQEKQKNISLIEKKTVIEKENIDQESIDNISKILALSKLYGDNINKKQLNNQRLYIGNPVEELWKEPRTKIIQKHEDYYKIFKDLYEKNMPWRIRKNTFIKYNYGSSFKFYSSLTPDFLDYFSETIVSEYLNTKGTLDISNKIWKLMAGSPDEHECLEIESYIKKKIWEKYSNYCRNMEMKFEIMKQNISKFSFYSEFDFEEKTNFCKLILNKFCILNHKKFGICLKDGDLRIMSGNPCKEEFQSIKENLESQLSTKENIYFTQPTFKIDKKDNFMSNFEFYSLFGKEEMINFCKLIISTSLKAEISSDKQMKCDIALKMEDIKIMTGYPEKEELDSIKNCIDEMKKDKIVYFLKNYQEYILKKSRIKNNEMIFESLIERRKMFYEKTLKSNYELYNEFDDSSLKYFVSSIASLKASKLKKHYKKGEIKILLGQASNSDVDYTINLIKTEIKRLKTLNKNVHQKLQGIDSYFEPYSLSIISFSNKSILFKESLLKDKYKVKESLSIKLKINTIIIHNKEDFDKFIEDSEKNQETNMFLFLLEINEKNQYEEFLGNLPFESDFFFKMKSDFVFCFNKENSSQELKEDFKCIKKIQTIVNPDKFHYFEDSLNSGVLNDKLVILIQSNIDKKYEIDSFKMMALPNISIGKLFLKRGFPIYFMTIIVPPNITYFQGKFSKRINFTQTIKIRIISKELHLNKYFSQYNQTKEFKDSDFNNFLTDVKNEINKNKHASSDLFVFIWNSESSDFWNTFFHKSQADSKIWNNQERRSIFFSIEENYKRIASKISENSEGNKQYAFVESHSELDKFIYCNIKERLEIDENLQIYLSNEFDEFNEAENYEKNKAYEMFLFHLDKKIMGEEFDREIAKELFYDQFNEKSFINKGDIIVFYGKALQKIENICKKLKTLIFQKKENLKIRLLLFEAKNLNSFRYENENDNTNINSNLIKSLGINKINIEIKYGEHIKEIEAELNPNFSLNFKYFETNFPYDSSNHKKGITIRIYDKKDDNFGSYQIKITDWVSKSKGWFDLDFIKKSIQKERNLIEIPENQKGVEGIPSLKLFFCYLNTTETENDIENLNYELDKWIKIKIDLNFFKISPELENQTNMLNKRFIEVNTANKLTKTKTLENFKDISKTKEQLKKKKQELIQSLDLIKKKSEEKNKKNSKYLNEANLANEILNKLKAEIQSNEKIYSSIKKNKKEKKMQIVNIIKQKILENREKIQSILDSKENIKDIQILKLLLNNHESLYRKMSSNQKISFKIFKSQLLGLYTKKDNMILEKLKIKLDKTKNSVADQKKLEQEKQIKEIEEKIRKKEHSLEDNMILEKLKIKLKNSLADKKKLEERIKKQEEQIQKIDEEMRKKKDSLKDLWNFDEESKLIENLNEEHEKIKKKQLDSIQNLKIKLKEREIQLKAQNLKNKDEINEFSKQLDDENTKINENKIIMEKLENEIERAQKINLENEKTDKIMLFFQSFKNETEKKKLKEYFQQLIKTVSRFYLTATVAESQIFKMNASTEVNIIETIAPLIPYGRHITLLISEFLNFRDQTIKMNKFESFSNIVPNSSILDEVIQNAALELVKIKKSLIIQMSENIQKGFLEDMKNKVKSIFIKKNQQIFKGLDTGAKIMANIDASSIIAYSYMNVLKISNDENELDIFNKKGVEENFKKAACLVNPKAYAKILLLENKWVDIDFKLNIEECFKNDNEFLKKFKQVNENYKNQIEKKKNYYFNCFKKHTKVHTQ